MPVSREKACVVLTSSAELVVDSHAGDDWLQRHKNLNLDVQPIKANLSVYGGLPLPRRRTEGP